MEGRVLDAVFSALADPTRRAMVRQLSHGPLMVNDFVGIEGASQPSVSKHLRILEQAGLVTRTKSANTRPVHLRAEALDVLEAWLTEVRLDWEGRLERLDRLLSDPE